MAGIHNVLAGQGGVPPRYPVTYTYSSPTTNASLNVTTLPGYVAGYSDITVTVDTGVHIYSTNTSTPALTLSGGATGDTVTLVNRGYIMGMGGAGATRASNTSGTASTSGGPALSLGFNTTINNTYFAAYIGGGGGGGGARARSGTNDYWTAGGGGAGGGRGGDASFGGTSGDNVATGGAGAASWGVSGSSGGQSTLGFGGGGGGGRIMPGLGGTPDLNSATGYRGVGGGAGGSGGGYSDNTYGGGGYVTHCGGDGGGSNSAGVTGKIGDNNQGLTVGSTNSVIAGAGGGGWGASGGTPSGTAPFTSVSSYLPGAAGGKAVNLNGRTVTWTSGDTSRVYGSVS